MPKPDRTFSAGSVFECERCNTETTLHAKQPQVDIKCPICAETMKLQIVNSTRRNVVTIEGVPYSPAGFQEPRNF